MTPEEQAAADAAQDKLIRDLAAQIGQMGKLGFDPSTIRKGIITAVSDTTSPPTVSINISGDTETTVASVRTLNNYTPLVDQTVLFVKQGAEIFLLGAVAATTPYGVSTTSDNGWIPITITNGTHGGNSNGNIYARRILDHGSWKVQWRGGWNPAGATYLIDTANALDADFRPSSKRTVLAARETSGGAVAVQFDFGTDGRVQMIGKNIAPASGSAGGEATSGAAPGGTTDSVDPVDSTTADPVDGHSHGVIGSHYHSVFVDNHWHGNGTHSHVVSVGDPSWVSLNGVEYFL